MSCAGVHEFFSVEKMQIYFPLFEYFQILNYLLFVKGCLHLSKFILVQVSFSISFRKYKNGHF